MTENTEQNRYKISFNGTQYLAEEFTSKAQIKQFIDSLKMPTTYPFNVGKIIDPQLELFKYEKSLGEAVLFELITTLSGTGKGRANVTEEMARRVGKLVLEKVIPEIKIDTLVEELVRKVASFKVGDEIQL